MAKKGDRKRPALTFYPKEWIWDIELRQCSPAARGLWIDLMCIMHEGVPYGHLTAPEDLVLRMIGVSGEVYLGLLAELEEVKPSGKRVAYRSPEGILYSKRMVLDEADRLIRKGNGDLGGNPDLMTHACESSDNQGRLTETETQRIEEKKKKTKEVEAWFDAEFWPLYPRKTHKPAALAAVKRHGDTPEARARIMTALRRALPALARELKPNGDFRPYPASWINSEPWLDEPDAPAVVVGPSLVSTMSPEIRRRLDERKRANDKGRL